MKIIISNHEREIGLNQLKRIIRFFNEEDFDCYIEGRGDGTTRLVIERAVPDVQLNNHKEVN